jgi:hypothetical protein
VYRRRIRRIEATHSDPREGLAKLLGSPLTLRIKGLQEEIPPLQSLICDFSFESFWSDRSPFGYRHWFEERVSQVHEAIGERLLKASDDHPSKAREGPRWDSERRELWYGQKRLKTLPARAKHQRSILDEFEVQNWPPVIKDPLVPRQHDTPRERLKYAIKALNRGLRKAAAGNSPIEFKQVDNYTSVTWVVQETP